MAAREGGKHPRTAARLKNVHGEVTKKVGCESLVFAGDRQSMRARQVPCCYVLCLLYILYVLQLLQCKDQYEEMHVRALTAELEVSLLTAS